MAATSLASAAANGIRRRCLSGPLISTTKCDGFRRDERNLGALPAAIDAIVWQGGRVSVHVNPDMFNERGVQLKSGAIVPVAKVPLPAELEQHGATVVNEPAERLLLDGHYYYSGEIPRITPFEKGRVDHLCRTSSDAPWQ